MLVDVRCVCASTCFAVASDTAVSAFVFSVDACVLAICAGVAAAWFRLAAGLAGLALIVCAIKPRAIHHQRDVCCTVVLALLDL